MYNIAENCADVAASRSQTLAICLRPSPLTMRTVSHQTEIDDDVYDDVLLCNKIMIQSECEHLSPTVYSRTDRSHSSDTN